MEVSPSSQQASALLLLQNLPESDHQTQKMQTQSLELTSLKSHQKQKKIMKKPQSILKKLRIQHPIAFTHVHSLFNLLGINESALKDNTFEESFFKTMFYINTVERVELRKHALIIQLKPSEKSLQPIPYLIERYKSFGDKKFYDIATALESVASKVTGQNFIQKLKKSFDGEPLSRFIDSMENQAYMCKVAPNKLVISRGLLELLGEDPENYAVEMCKYKMPLREIISAESYGEIMQKSIENIGSICDFINAAISVEELHAKTSIDFTDYIINRQNKKIYCNLILFMPTPQMSCIQVRQVLKESDDVRKRCQNFARKREIVEKHCEEIRYSEAEILKNIMRVPDGLLKGNKMKLAEYRDISSMA